MTASEEANIVCDIINNNFSNFLKIGWGKFFKIEKFSFELIQADRNIVYKICGGHTWYLKIAPPDNREQVIEHEAVGLKHYHQMSEQLDYNKVCATFRCSSLYGYVLVSQLPGETINKQYYKTCFKLGKRSKKAINKWYSLLGSQLALLHLIPGNQFSINIKSNRKSSFIQLKQLIDKTKKPTEFIDRIEEWYSNAEFDSFPASFIHGNLKPENILLSKDTLFLIDFENCGIGSIYDDLSFFSNHLFLTRALYYYPWKNSQEVLTSFIQGYKDVGEFNEKLFINYLIARLSHYYLQSYFFQKSIPTVSSIPVRKSSLYKLILHLMKIEKQFFNLSSIFTM